MDGVAATGDWKKSLATCDVCLATGEGTCVVHQRNREVNDNCFKPDKLIQKLHSAFTQS